MSGIKIKAPRCFCIDVDGVMTNGNFYYSEAGKVMKVFGPDDHDALLLLSRYLNICFVTGDRKGFSISKRRIVEDMKMRLELVSTTHRAGWIDNEFGLDKTVYMGDGIFDIEVFKAVFYSIAPADAYPPTRQQADFVTTCGGGRRAVAEACVHLMTKFFPESQGADLQLKQGQGEWGI